MVMSKKQHRAEHASRSRTDQKLALHSPCRATYCTVVSTLISFSRHDVGVWRRKCVYLFGNDHGHVSRSRSGHL
nr:hypothetical protein CFP56_09418 [Quercus suber]